MADITITITADENDLRTFAKDIAESFFGAQRIAAAIAAALPKPRIVVRPGMVLRHKSDGERAVVLENAAGAPIVRAIRWAAKDPHVESYAGLDPDEWEILLDAEDPS